MTIMSTRTPKTMAMVPGEDKPEPKTSLRVIKMYTHQYTHEIQKLFCGKVPMSKLTLVLVEARLTSLAMDTLMQ